MQAVETSKIGLESKKTLTEIAGEWSKRVGLWTSLGLGMLLVNTASTPQNLNTAQNLDAKNSSTLEQLQTLIQPVLPQVDLENLDMPDLKIPSLEEAWNTVEAQLQSMPVFFDFDLEGKTTEEKAELILTNVSNLMATIASIMVILKTIAIKPYVNSATEESGHTVFSPIGSLGDSFLWLSRDLVGLATRPDKLSVAINIVNHGLDIFSSLAVLVKLMLIEKGAEVKNLEVKNTMEIFTKFSQEFNSRILGLKSKQDGKDASLESDESLTQAEKLNRIQALLKSINHTDFKAAKQEMSEIQAEVIKLAEQINPENLNKLKEKGVDILKIFAPKTRDDITDLTILVIYALSSAFLGGMAAIGLGLLKDFAQTARTNSAKDKPHPITVFENVVDSGYWATQLNDICYCGYGISQFIAMLWAYEIRMEKALSLEKLGRPVNIPSPPAISELIDILNRTRVVSTRVESDPLKKMKLEINPNEAKPASKSTLLNLSSLNSNLPESRKFDPSKPKVSPV